MKVEAPWGTTELGTVEAAPTIGIIDYSRRVTDAYGTTTVVERGFARRMSVRLAIASDVVDAVQEQLSRLRATVATWTADDRFAALSVQGFVKDFAIDVPGAEISFCTLTVEGIVEPIAPAEGGEDPAPGGQPSTLRLIQPVTIGDAQLVAINIAEADHGGWNPSGSYGKGDRVILTTTHRVYESAIAGNVGNDPAGASGKWFDVGPVNRWAMFDQALGTASRAPGAIDVTINAGTADAITLLDIAGGSTARAVASGYDRTVSAEGGSATFYDLPGGQVTVTIAGPGMVAVGTLLVGRLVALGITEAGASAGITDYSRKVVDDFGEVTLVERAYAKRMTAKALIRTEALDLVTARIATVRARPALWIGQSGSGALTVYGFFKDFAIEVGETVSKLSLSIEGLSKATQLADPNAPLNDLRDRLEELRADIDAIASDGVLTHGREKGRLIRDYLVLTNGLAALNARFIALTSPADLVAVRDTANARRVELDTLLLSYAPAWNDLTTDTVINGEQLRVTWATAAQAISAFSAAITGRPGASAVTLVANTATTIVSASTVRGTANTGWGSDAAYSQEVYGGGAVASFTLPPVHGDDVMVGLTQGTGTDRGNSYNSITFALHRNNQGLTQAFVNGNGWGAPGPVAVGAMAGRVHFDGRTVRWFVNETQIAEYPWLGPNDDPYAPEVLLRFRATLASSSPIVENITFLPAGGAGRDGTNGTSPYVMVLSNEAHLLPADHLGNVTSYEGASTSIRVFYGGDDVTASFALESIGNPQALSIIGGYPTYTVNAGFDAGEDAAIATFNIVGAGEHAGIRLTRDFSLAKSKAGADGSPAPLVKLTATQQVIKYNEHDQIVSGSITFTSTRLNAPGVPQFRVDGFDGTNLAGPGPASAFAGFPEAFTSTGPDDITLLQGYLDGADNYGGGIRVSVAIGAVFDVISLPKVKDGAPGASAPLILTQWSIDGVSNWHDNYFGADVYQRQSNDNGVTWGPAYRAIGEAGTVGSDGTSPSIVFKRSATVPAAPANNSGNPPAGWSDGPPQGDELLWQSTATFRGATQLTGWSAPVRISGKDGASAPLILTQWSINGIDGWHANYFGADVYQRQSNDNGATWGPAYRVIGEAGTVGPDGTSPSTVFKRSATVPGAPADNSGNPPAGWSDGPPQGTDFLWQSNATFRGATQLTSWSAPVRISGKDGEPGVDGFIVEAIAPFVIPVYSSGATKPSWTGGAGAIRLRKGAAQQTAGVTYSLENAVAMAGLALNGADFSFSGITADVGRFDIVATFGGIAYRSRVEVKKVYDGSAAFRGSVSITGTNNYGSAAPVGSGQTPIPGGSTVILTANINYSPPQSNNVTAYFTGRVYLFYRNVTNDGPLTALGSVDGSQAYRINRGTAQEPEMEDQGGSVSASFSFASAPADKIYYYEARFERANNSPNYNVTLSGVMKIEVVG